MHPSPWSWELDWVEVSAVTVLAAAYAAGASRYGVSRQRAVTFAAALVLVLAVSVTPLATLALHYLLAAHLVQNVALAEWAPALAVAGLSPPMAVAIARLPLVPTLTHPLVALPLWLASYAAWHVPPVYDAALRNALLLHLEHASYFATGLLLWWPVFRAYPRELTSGAKAAYLFAAFVLASPLGLLIALVPDPIYGFYQEAPRLWGVSPLEDQVVGGMLMAGSEAVVFFALFSVYALRFLSEEA